jgi:Arc/MetJ family transcription regulator
MRTNIVIDDQIMNEALNLGNFSTKKEAVEAGLRLIIRLKKQEEIRKYRGKLSWEGDLDEMRTDCNKLSSKLPLIPKNRYHHSPNKYYNSPLEYNYSQRINKLHGLYLVYSFVMLTFDRKYD